jgi:lipopolysaccharide transport system permease protein
MSTVVFTVVFGKIANLSAGEVAYPLLVLSGMAPWVYFSSTTSECSNSLISNASLITKVYFPRIAVPIATVLVNLVDFTITFTLLLMVLIYYGHSLSWTLLFIPASLFVLIMLSIGVGLWTSCLNVKYRDLQFILPFVLTLGLYISPIGYSSALVPETWRWLYNLNPLVGIIDCFRWAVFGSRYDFHWWTLGYSFLTAVVLISSGTYFFRSVERELVDIL